MATAESVKSKLTGLLASANAATGNADADLTAAVNALIEGYGQGGASNIYMAQITPAENISTLTIEHNLGTSDILCALVWAETFGDYVPTENKITSQVWLKTNIPTRVNSSTNRASFEAFGTYSTSTSNVNAVALKNSMSYITDAEIGENIFPMRAGSYASATFYGGVTYTVVIMAASAFSAS